MSYEGVNMKSLSLILFLVIFCSVNCFSSDELTTKEIKVDIRQIDVNLFPEINVYVQVSNENNQLISGLTLNNFTLTEQGDNEPEPLTKHITKFNENTEKTSASIGILIDSSGSMENFFTNVQEAAKDFIDKFVSTDQAFIIQFNDKINMIQSLTSNKTLLKNAIDNITCSGGTAMYSAIDMGLETLREQIGLKTLVVITDGKDTESSISKNYIIQNSNIFKIPIFFIGLGDINSNILIELSQSTNGIYFDSPKSDDLNQLYLHIAEMIRNQYVLSFITDNHDKIPRTITVQVSISRELFSIDVERYESPHVDVWANIICPEQIRLGRKQVFWIRYGNRGNINSKGVSLTISGIPKDSEWELTPQFIHSNEHDLSKIPIYKIANELIYIPCFIPLMPYNSINYLKLEITPFSTNQINLNVTIIDNIYNFSSTDPILKFNSKRKRYLKSNKDAKPINVNQMDILNACIECLQAIADTIKEKITPSFSLPDKIEFSKKGTDYFTKKHNQYISQGIEGAMSVSEAEVDGLIFIIKLYTKIDLSLFKNLITEVVLEKEKECGATLALLIIGCSEVNQQKKNTSKALIKNSLSPCTESSRSVQVVTSIDPNNKYSQKSSYISLNKQDLFYVITFENLDIATASVEDIQIIDFIDDDFEWDSLTFLESSHIPEIVFDNSIGKITWTFKNINLPPNINPPEGEGYVSYSIKPKSNLLDSTQLINKAMIDFEIGYLPDPIETDEVIHIIDSCPPKSKVESVRDKHVIQLEWSGTDDGSGIKDYTIYISENGEPFKPLLINTKLASHNFSGETGSIYRLYSIATDNVGNIESAPIEPDTTITIKKIAKNEGGGCFIKTISTDIKDCKKYYILKN